MTVVPCAMGGYGYLGVRDDEGNEFQLPNAWFPGSLQINQIITMTIDDGCSEVPTIPK